MEQIRRILKALYPQTHETQVLKWIYAILAEKNKLINCKYLKWVNIMNET